MANLSSYDSDVLSEHIIYQDVRNVVLHSDVHNMLFANNNCLDNDNLALELLKIENDRLTELLISQDLVHTTLNSLAAINDYKSMEQKASGSKPRNNTKKDRITQTSSSNKKKNSVEDHPRIAKSSLNSMNRVSKLVCYANVKHVVLNANSELIYATCHECMFVAIHVLCVCDYLKDVNARVKSKYVKSRLAKKKKKKIWKSIGKVYINVGYSWKPTGWIFTIDGNTCLLTRIISTKVEPPRKSISTIVVKQTQPSSNKSRKLNNITNVGLSSKSKTVGSKISNYSKPMQNWGSNVSTAPSSSRVNCRLYKSYSGTVRFGNDQIEKIIDYGDYQLGNVTILRVYYVEGLGYNLFSMVPAAVTRRPAYPTDSSVSTSIEQDVPSVSTSSNQEQEQSPVISEGVEEQLPTA
ncbi:hypothetical protein Tco_0951655 [Tanacetum coccineum]|uniref:Uncharacterized protein n=1 Tax=Tanacetum coccineum TaxID=301880 RepID=A0ABQ5DV49_9ASTR